MRASACRTAACHASTTVPTWPWPAASTHVTSLHAQAGSLAIVAVLTGSLCASLYVGPSSLTGCMCAAQTLGHLQAACTVWRRVIVSVATLQKARWTEVLQARVHSRAKAVTACAAPGAGICQGASASNSVQMSLTSAPGAPPCALSALPNALAPSHEADPGPWCAGPCAAAAAAQAAAACRLRAASARRSCCAACAATSAANVARSHAGFGCGVPGNGACARCGNAGLRLAVLSTASARAPGAIAAAMSMLVRLFAARCLLARAARMLCTCAAGSAAQEGVSNNPYM